MAGNDQESQSEAKDEINLRVLVFKYLQYWRWFLISVILSCIVGVLFYCISDQRYEVSVSILLKEDKPGATGSGRGALGGLESLGLLSTTSNIDNEIAILSSPNLMRQVVYSLELYTSYFEDGFFRNNEVYTDCPYYVSIDSVSPKNIKGRVEITLKKVAQGVEVEGKYIYKKNKINIESSVIQLPGYVDLPSGLGRLSIFFRQGVSEEKLSDRYHVHIKNPQKEAYALTEALSISSTTKRSSVLSLDINSLNANKGASILKEMVKTYNTNNIDDNNEVALNTSLFVDERLKGISAELSNIEDDVVDYKEKQSITDLGAEARLYVENASSLNQKQNELGTQLKTVELVEDFILQDKNNYKLIPNLGISDPGLVGVISNYNSLLLSYHKLERSVSEDNPSFNRALDDLTNTRSSILAALSNIKKSLNISIQEAEKQSAKIATRVNSVPSQERGLLEIMRQQQIKQSLYLYLMKVKEETNVSMASYSDKAKIIIDPIIPEQPVSPKRSLIFFCFFLIGIFIPVIIIYMRDKMQVNIADRQELERLSEVSVIGEIMAKGSKEDILVIKANRTSPIIELFRTLRNNMQFILGSSERKVMLVTSTIPGEGKTFISINLAASFALLDKKVLLIGLDIRNPKLSEDMTFRKGLGVTSYLSGATADWKSLLVSMDGFPTLDILQAGVIPPNPNELLMKPAMKQLFDEAKKHYDLIIIDSAPIGVVSDTFLMAPYADTTVYVTRENVTPKQAVSFINEIYRDKKLPNIYLVMNGVELAKNKGRYGYGYTYGYGVNIEE